MSIKMKPGCLKLFSSLRLCFQGVLAVAKANARAQDQAFILFMHAFSNIWSL